MANRFRSILYRALQLILLVFLVYGFALTLPIDLAILMAGDYLLYFEVATSIWLAAQATRLGMALKYAQVVASGGWHRVRRVAVRARRSAARRLGRPADSDEDRPWGVLVPA